MKIIRWLLSHTVLILLIVAVIYGYMFWGNLAGDDTPAGKALAYLSSEFDDVSEFVAAVKAKQEKLSQYESAEINPSEAPEPSSRNDVPVLAASVDSGTQIQPTEAPAVEKNNFTAPVYVNRSENSDYRGVEPQQLSSRYSHDQAQVAVKSNASEGAIKDTFVSAQIEKQLDNVDGEGRLVDDGLKQDSRQGDDRPGDVKQSDDIREIWITARNSFYQRKYDLSEQNYQKVIDGTEDNIDAYGELGNVYFNQGKKEQAASAYFEAAAILVRKGQVNRAQSLMGLLRHLDKAKAGELQKLIDSAAS